MGSSRAHLLGWKLNMSEKTAICYQAGHRQLKPMQERVNVKPIAEEVTRLIINHKEDERLKWNDDGTVRILIGEIFPSGSAVNQTLQGRRKRFKQALDNHLNEAGWQKIKVNV